MLDAAGQPDETTWLKIPLLVSASHVHRAIKQKEGLVLGPVDVPRGAESGGSFTHEQGESTAALRLVDQGCHPGGEEPPRIASAAGVARPTVFTTAGSKALILKEAIDLALAGDDEPIPVSQRGWFLAMIGEPDQARMLELHARNLRTMYERVADPYVAAKHAAAADPIVADLWSTMQSQRLLGARSVSSSLATKGPLREGMDEHLVANVLWCTATPMDHRRFVRERGWTPHRYQTWLADFMITTFLAAE